MIVALFCDLAMAIGFTPIWGNGGLWAAFLGLMLVRAVVLGFSYPQIERESFASAA